MTQFSRFSVGSTVLFLYLRHVKKCSHCLGILLKVFGSFAFKQNFFFFFCCHTNRRLCRKMKKPFCGDVLFDYILVHVPLPRGSAHGLTKWRALVGYEKCTPYTYYYYVFYKRFLLMRYSVFMSRRLGGWQRYQLFNSVTSIEWIRDGQILFCNIQCARVDQRSG